MKLYTKYQRPGPSDFRQEDYQISKAWAFRFQTRRFLKVFSIRVYVKQVGPRAGPLLTLELSFEQLGRGPLDKATKYQSPGPSGFRQEDF